MADEKNTEQGCSGSCEGCASAGSCGSVDPKSFLAPQNKASSIKHVIGVLSGKGGVGKSMVAASLAVELKKQGYKTGILDADITGPSMSKMFGFKNGQLMGDDNGIYPMPAKSGVEVISLNMMLDKDDTPVLWRGPVISGVVKQFWSDVVWGELDYLIVDMPPGTGDVAMTVFQSLPVGGVIIVTSPQDLVTMIVKKAYNMAEAMKVPVLGIVENFSYLECPDCGKRIEVFGKSNAAGVAKDLGCELLGRIPIVPDFAAKCDEGRFDEIDNGEMITGAIEKLKALA